MHAVFTSGVSFSNEFTTVLRVTRHAMLDIAIDPHDNGSDPLPSELGNSTFTSAIGKNGIGVAEDDVSADETSKQVLGSESLLS
jgi:hypothetical protein